MTAIEDLFPYITPDSADMPTVMIKRHIADAARDFANQTGCVRETFTLSGSADVGTATLTPLNASEEVAGIISVQVDGRDVSYSYNQGIITLTVTPTTAYALVVKTYTKPKHYAIEISEVLGDEYQDGIVAGTLFRIKKTGGGNWFDAQGAAFNAQLLNDAISQTKMDMITQKSTQPLTIQSIRFI